MLSEELEQDITGEDTTTYAEDTALPKDLAEAVAIEKQRRQETLATRRKILSFFLSWSFHATGVAIAKWCLVLGGGAALWMAVTLCFTISFVPASFIASGINVNYTEGRLEATNMERLGGIVVQVGAASVTTWLAIKDYESLNRMTQETVAQMSEDIRIIQKQYPQSDPWLSIGIAVLLVVGGFVAMHLVTRR
ncbi:hypothetical protein BZZ01_04545 [Nostocales cyanobacterium HT-58-2]|nr:hypothetical protein BZZ01_04545 [Nostocales cyanobacterium HT-58-2]